MNAQGANSRLCRIQGDFEISSGLLHCLSGELGWTALGEARHARPGNLYTPVRRAAAGAVGV